MTLEAGRDLVRGVALLVLAAFAYWGEPTVGLALIAVMGATILQSAFTDWCPVDPALKPLGLKSKAGE